MSVIVTNPQRLPHPAKAQGWRGNWILQWFRLLFSAVFVPRDHVLRDWARVRSKVISHPFRQVPIRWPMSLFFPRESSGFYRMHIVPNIGLVHGNRWIRSRTPNFECHRTKSEGGGVEMRMAFETTESGKISSENRHIPWLQQQKHWKPNECVNELKYWEISPSPYYELRGIDVTGCVYVKRYPARIRHFERTRILYLVVVI